MTKLTVVIISYNEEEQIKNTLDSVSFADEIIVVDSFSSDKTVEIASKYTDKIFCHRFEDFSLQRNYALSLVTNDWVFFIDCDEVVTDLLREEIESVVRENDLNYAYSIGRNNIFMGKRTRFSGVQNDRVIRLFPKTVRYGKRKVHEIIDINGVKVKYLKGRLQHFTYKSYDSMLKKVYHYSTLKATEMYESGYKPTLLKMIVKPSARFVKHYIIQGGFMDGKRGLIIAYIRALEVFQRLTKTWRMQQGEKF